VTDRFTAALRAAGLFAAVRFTAGLLALAFLAAVFFALERFAAGRFTAGRFFATFFAAFFATFRGAFFVAVLRVGRFVAARFAVLRAGLRFAVAPRFVPTLRGDFFVTRPVGRAFFRGVAIGTLLLRAVRRLYHNARGTRATA
jgi:hypothetical protein